MARMRHGGVVLAALGFGAALATGALALAATQPPTVIIQGTPWVEVSTAPELLYVDQNQSAYLAANIRLTGNIDLGGASWQPFGTPFTGTFDGQHFTVSGYQVTGGGDVGFIDRAGTGSTIENLTVTGSVSGISGNIGGLVGRQTGGTIQNVSATGNVSGTITGSIGALVGYQAGGTIQNASASGSASGPSSGFTSLVGGLVGNQGPFGTIQYSFASGAVNGQNNSAIGGLVGAAGGHISYSYATGSVAAFGGFSDVGGLVGWANWSIQNVYATGDVTGIATDQVGGLVGSQIGGSTDQGYAIGSVANSPSGTTVGGFVGAWRVGTFSNDLFLQTGSLPGVGFGSPPGTPITGDASAALKSAATYASWPSFAQKWGLNAQFNGGYPYLLAVPPPETPVPVPSLEPQTVTFDGVTVVVVGNLGDNLPSQIANGDSAGYVEERTAIQAGASYAGEGTMSAYMSAILSGAGVGQQAHVTAVEQGQFAALYQKLGIIPVWSGNSVTLASGLQALVKDDATTLAIENYLVQLYGFGWPEAIAQGQAGLPLHNG